MNIEEVFKQFQARIDAIQPKDDAETARPAKLKERMAESTAKASQEISQLMQERETRRKESELRSHRMEERLSEARLQEEQRSTLIAALANASGRVAAAAKKRA